MSADILDMSLAPVRRHIDVHASVDDAFHVFATDMDSWWPRGHHIGASPLVKQLIEGRVGGRCYSTHTDGGECEWGQVLAWEPPARFVMAWQITPDWKYQPDLAQSSEVEVRFHALGGGMTRVELEHRHFERHGAGGAAMRAGVDTPQGWNGLLQLYNASLQQFLTSRGASS